MAESPYFAGADAQIKVGSTVMAVVEGWETNVRWDTNDKYGSDSIFLQASARYNQKVEVKLKHSKFDPAIASWWMMEVLRGGIDGKDKNGNTVALGKIADSSYVKLFDIVGIMKPFETGGVNLRITLHDCYFPDIPFGIKEFDWIAIDVTAVGSAMTWDNSATLT